MRLWEQGGSPPALMAVIAFKIVLLGSLTFVPDKASSSDYSHVCNFGTEELQVAANSTTNFQCGLMLALAPEAASNMVYRGPACTEKTELVRLIPGAQLVPADAQYIGKRSLDRTLSPVYSLKIGDTLAEDVQLCYRCTTSEISGIHGEVGENDPINRGQIPTDTLCKILIRVTAPQKTLAAALGASIGRSLSVGLAFLTGLCF
uniref:SRS domain protein n=1 Tax=Toxoplasma gondii COUG TaxID=1074873 RepID=A0A2G8Y1T3_TOXGO|nr:SRS domain protein [Toxoplasma gondii COUG]